jgi:murein L,D-transpeptidase YcbB/YkuD
MLACAACAALTIPVVPAIGATSPEIPTASQSFVPVDPGTSAFYASRRGAPLWLRDGPDSPAARELISVLMRAPLDGFAAGPQIAQQAQALMARASAGDQAALANADQVLSNAWVRYVQTLQRPPVGMTYADSWVAPRPQSATNILLLAAAAPSLSAHVRTVSSVNPLYAQLRDAAWAQVQTSGSAPDPRVLASLDRARDMPVRDRYVMVDTAGARLYMIDNGQIVDSMKVIVGKADPNTQTPMLASTIYYATLNPYWHVDGEMVRSLIAKNVLEQGLGYNSLLDPAKVDWHAVAEGREIVRVRQLPGPANSMGRVKIGFPNASDIYLHDTPNKEAFAQQDRDLSHGCIRLEDAARLARWLMGREPQAASLEPEQNVQLSTPVPIYVTYLTAQVRDGQLTYLNDIYGRDAQISSEVAALR